MEHHILPLTSIHNHNLLLYFPSAPIFFSTSLMELCFSPKSHSLTLISGSLSSPQPSIRREFLGCSHNLRPPGLPIRGTKCRRIRIREKNSQSLLINASFGSNSVLVVFAVSAVSIAYLNHHLSNRKKGSKEALGSLSHGLTRLVRNIAKHIVGSSLPDVGDVHNHEGTNLAIQSEEIADKALEESVHVLENTLMNESPLLIETEESHDAGYGVSDSPDHMVSVESESYNLSPLLPAIPEPEIVAPLVLVRGISELTLENDRKETVIDSECSQLIAKESNSIASVPVNYEVDKESDFSSYNCVIKEFDREDIYKFYEENQSTEESASKLNGLKAAASSASSSMFNSFPVFNINVAVKDAELSAKQSQIAEFVERKVPLSRYERGYSHKNDNAGRRGFPRGKKKGHLIQDGHTKLLEFPYPNGAHAANKDHSSEHVHAYNRLLKDGRLAECVDVLEDMESRGLLDMNKIYHAKFFKICKHQKAVKEAFRFCNLVPNPTLSTFNMLMTVCVSSQDSEGAFQVLRLAQEAGLKADCKLYTTLISTCAKSGQVDAMFEVFHEMVNAGVEPNIHTYGALIDGCGRAGQMAKAFGAYGIMRSKKVNPDRVVFNALISACGQSGAVDRAFDVLAEMGTETQPIDPDHITVGALINACAKAGQVDRAKEVYKMMHKYNIKGTPEVYTIAVNCCSQTGDWEFAQSVYHDMTRKGVVPDEMFLSALIDVAGHAGMLDVAFETLQEAKIQGTQLGIIPYSSLMGACSNAKNWQKALELYDNIKSVKLKPTLSIMNALITALCDGDQLPKAIEVLSEMKRFGFCPNTVTYSILLAASERKDDLEVGLMLLSQAKEDSVAPTHMMYKCIIGLCLRRYEKACAVGEPILSFDSGRPQIKNEWTSMALKVYREAIAAGQMPTMEVLSQVLGCLQLPYDALLKKRLVENLGVTADSSKISNLCSLLDGFGEYDPCSFSLLEEAASHGIVPCVSFKGSPIVIDTKNLQIHIAEVYLLTILKGLKHRLAAGAKLPNVTILLPVEVAQVKTPEGEKMINLAGWVGQEVASLLRRLGLPYQGNESYGKVRINGISLRRWLQPKLASPFSGRPEELNSSLSSLGRGIFHQQRDIRTCDFSLE